MNFHICFMELSESGKTRGIFFSDGPTRFNLQPFFSQPFASATYVRDVPVCLSLWERSTATYRNRGGMHAVAERFFVDRHGLLFTSTRWQSVGWRVCIVTITSSQVFTTTRRHRTHLYLSSRRARPYAFVCMHGMLRYATVVSSTLRVSQQRREWRNLRAVSEDSLRIGQF